MDRLGHGGKERGFDAHQLDLRVDKKFTFDTWYLSVYLDVQNVYNQKNTEFYQWAYDFSRRVDVYGVPVLPTLGVKGEF